MITCSAKTMAESKQGSVKGILKSNKDRSHKPKFQVTEAAANRCVYLGIMCLFASESLRV